MKKKSLVGWVPKEVNFSNYFIKNEGLIEQVIKPYSNKAILYEDYGEIVEVRKVRVTIEEIK